MALGEFIEDRVQLHNHQVRYGSSGDTTEAVNASSSTGSNYKWTIPYSYSNGTGVFASTTSTIGRFGTTTEVKAVGMNFIIRY